MNWVWRGEAYSAGRSEYLHIKVRAFYFLGEGCVWGGGAFRTRKGPLFGEAHSAGRSEYLRIKVGT